MLAEAMVAELILHTAVNVVELLVLDVFKITLFLDSRLVTWL